MITRLERFRGLAQPFTHATDVKERLLNESDRREQEACWSH